MALSIHNLVLTLFPTTTPISDLKIKVRRDTKTENDRITSAWFDHLEDIYLKHPSCAGPPNLPDFVESVEIPECGVVRSVNDAVNDCSDRGTKLLVPGNFECVCEVFDKQNFTALDMCTDTLCTEEGDKKAARDMNRQFVKEGSESCRETLGDLVKMYSAGEKISAKRAVVLALLFGAVASLTV